MAKHYYKTPDRNQLFIKQICIEEYIPKKHLAKDIRSIISTLNLNGFDKIKYKNKTNAKPDDYKKLTDGGHPSYPNLEMVSMVVYAYLIGIQSPYVMAQSCKTDFAFKYLMSDFEPDQSTISRFMNDYLEEFSLLYYELLRHLIDSNLIDLDKIAIDGSVIKSTGSKYLHVSLEQCDRRINKIPNRITQLKTNIIQNVNITEKEKEMIEKKIRKLEKNYKELIILRPILEKAHNDYAKTSHKKKSEVKGPYLSPNDEGSRIMRDKYGGYINGKNVQIAVENRHQFVVESGVYNAGCDNSVAPEFLERVVDTLGKEKVENTKFLEDNGYFGEKNLEKGKELGLDMYVSPVSSNNLDEYANTDVIVPKTKSKIKETVYEMKKKMSIKENISIYKERSKIVEPVFGYIKVNRGFKRFSKRGKNSEHEWKLVCFAHNLLKLINIMKKTGKYFPDGTKYMFITLISSILTTILTRNKIKYLKLMKN